MSDPSKVEEQSPIQGNQNISLPPEVDQQRGEALRKIKVIGATREHPVSHIAAIKSFLGSVGDDKAIMESPMHFNYGYNTHVGKRFYMSSFCTIIDTGRVDIGDNVHIGPNVKISTVGHAIDPIERTTREDIAKPIKIGNNVWIGGSASILPGVTIGNGVTVGAGAVVDQDVPDNVVVAGVPAKIIKRV